ncbi:hypothetical protein [Microbispora rosea]|uniref:hypothetical protein n=1 Tax=Microbispora rosea TaxID=58117 RepID=UPI001A3CE7AE|nr:hypothetical protein [Microbispora rosea]GIH51953.1 hypothetical protein Mro03_71320 [Microbispora rosea subsp. rosea]
MTKLACWGELEQYGVDEVWKAVRRRAENSGDDDQGDESDLMTPEWNAFTSPQPVKLPDFTTEKERLPAATKRWLSGVVLVTRLRKVSALYGFTRIDAPEWGEDGGDAGYAPISAAPPTWVPCAEMRGEGIFLRFREDELAAWEQRDDVRRRCGQLRAGHDRWRAQRKLEPGRWPGRPLPAAAHLRPRAYPGVRAGKRLQRRRHRRADLRRNRPPAHGRSAALYGRPGQ